MAFRLWPSACPVSRNCLIIFLRVDAVGGLAWQNREVTTPKTLWGGHALGTAQSRCSGGEDLSDYNSNSLHPFRIQGTFLCLWAVFVLPNTPQFWWLGRNALRTPRPLDLDEDHPGGVTGLLDGREERNELWGWQTLFKTRPLVANWQQAPWARAFPAVNMSCLI